MEEGSSGREGGRDVGRIDLIGRATSAVIRMRLSLARWRREAVMYHGREDETKASIRRRGGGELLPRLNSAAGRLGSTKKSQAASSFVRMV